MFLLGILDNSWSHMGRGSVDRISLSPVSEMTRATAGLQKKLFGVSG